MKMRKATIWLRRTIPLLIVLCMMCSSMSLQAASKITLKSGAAAPSTVYAGRSYTLAVKGQAVKFYSSNKTVATIGMTTGKFKPVNPGTVKITAKSKKTGKAVATKTFTVLKRARSVSVDSESEICLLKGDVLALKATVEPANSTDVIRFYSSDKDVATVGLTSGKITAKKQGVTTITVYAKATKATSNSSKNNKVCTVTVHVMERNVFPETAVCGIETEVCIRNGSTMIPVSDLPEGYSVNVEPVTDCTYSDGVLVMTSENGVAEVVVSSEDYKVPCRQKIKAVSFKAAPNRVALMYEGKEDQECQSFEVNIESRSSGVGNVYNDTIAVCPSPYFRAELKDNQISLILEDHQWVQNTGKDIIPVLLCDESGKSVLGAILCYVGYTEKELPVLTETGSVCSHDWGESIYTGDGYRVITPCKRCGYNAIYTREFSCNAENGHNDEYHHDDYNHWKVCTVCGRKGDKKFHDFAFDGFCKICSCKKPSSSSDPSPEPSQVPTEEPSPEPSQVPTEEPSPEPSQVPTEEPSPEPSQVPTEEPRPEPSPSPTEGPSSDTNPDAVFAESTAYIIKGAKAMASIDTIAIHVSVLSQL